MTDPDAATTAARDAVAEIIHRFTCECFGSAHDDDREAADAAIAAARPVIEAKARASERQRIRQLAIDRGNWLMGPPQKGCGSDAEALWAFADLLDGAS